MFEPDLDYSERWSVVRWIDGEHPEVIEAETSVHPPRENLAMDLAAVLAALSRADVPAEAVNNPDLRSYRGEPIATMDRATRENIERCRSLAGLRFRPGRRGAFMGRSHEAARSG